MRIVLTDGSEFTCRNFKAIDSGVLLTKDKKRKKVIGFVPHHQLRYVIEDDHEPTRPDPDETRSVTGDAETPAQRREDTAAGDTLVIERPTTGAEPGIEEDGATADENGVEEDGETADENGVARVSDLRRLGGLGSTYAERLRTAGYETLADLAVADPVTVAEAASVAPGRGRRWVNAAGRAVAAEVNSTERDGETDDTDGDGELGDTDGDGEVDGADGEDELDDTDGDGEVDGADGDGETDDTDELGGADEVGSADGEDEADGEAKRDRDDEETNA